MTETQPIHPFQPGVAVAVRVSGRRYGFEPMHWRIDEVLKVHKSGKFTLKSDPKQQWRGFATNPPHRDLATGHGVGSYYGTLNLLADVQEKVARDNEEYDRWQRYKRIEVAVEKMTYEQATDEAISLFEAAIAALKPPTGKS